MTSSDEDDVESANGVVCSSSEESSSESEDDEGESSNALEAAISQGTNKTKKGIAKQAVAETPIVAAQVVLNTSTQGRKFRGLWKAVMAVPVKKTHCPALDAFYWLVRKRRKK